MAIRDKITVSIAVALMALYTSSARAQFYVATNGSDTHPGTLALPFLTLTKCQTAMRGSSTKTCYIRAGTYTPASSRTSCGDSGLSQAVILTASDNGEPGPIIHLTAATGQLSSMVRLAGVPDSALVSAQTPTTLLSMDWRL
jgi:hypothetical protein